MANETKIEANPGEPFVTIRREFEAQRELVFKAYTDPDLIVQWLGPRRLTMKIDYFEPRTGGRYRYVHVGADGVEHWFRGVIHDVEAPSRIIQTFEYEGLPERGHVALETLTLQELPGNRTLTTTLSAFQRQSDRDGMVQSGMAEGVYDSHSRLDELFQRGL